MRTVWCVWRGDDGRCRVDGITYKLICKGCDEVYVGETSKNAYTRGLEHLYSVIAPVKDPSKPKPTLRAHVDERHSADPSPPAFKMEVTGVYAGDATKRQVSEAVKIRNTAGQMNRPVMTSVGGAASVTRKKTAARASPP